MEFGGVKNTIIASDSAKSKSGTKPRIASLPFHVSVFFVFSLFSSLSYQDMIDARVRCNKDRPYFFLKMRFGDYFSLRISASNYMECLPD